MEYFVTSEDHPYYSWQLEILIESFKQVGCQDELLIVLSQFNAPPSSGPNLVLHKRLTGFENIGRRRGFEPLNQIYNLLWCLQAGLIKQPLVYLQPDMVLRSPVTVDFSNQYPEFVFQPDPFFTLEKVEKEIGPVSKWLNKDYNLQWIPVSNFFVVNRIPIEFFELIVKRAELLATRQLMEGKQISKYTMLTAIATTFADHIENIFCRGDYSFVSPILDGTTTPIISYEQGILPEFHKSMFPYSAPAFVSFGNPLEILANLYPTPNAYYVSMLANKICNSSSKR